jgi:F-type H+-transporting ATPase subunit c
MNTEMIQMIATGLTIAIGAIGPAFAMGKIASSGLESIGRNPDSENAIRTTMVLGLAFVESIAIFTLVIALIIKFV